MIFWYGTLFEICAYKSSPSIYDFFFVNNFFILKIGNIRISFQWHICLTVMNKNIKINSRRCEMRKRSTFDVFHIWIVIVILWSRNCLKSLKSKWLHGYFETPLRGLSLPVCVVCYPSAPSACFRVICHRSSYILGWKFPGWDVSSTPRVALLTGDLAWRPEAGNWTQSRETETRRGTETSLALTHWGRDKLNALSQTTFSNAFSWMKMLEYRLKFHWSLFLGVQLTISQHWFR